MYRHLISVAGLTLLSRVTGFFRDVMQATEIRCLYIRARNPHAADASAAFRGVSHDGFESLISADLCRSA